MTIAVLGTGGGSMAPLADLLRRAIGPAGTAAGAVAAIVLTLGAVNAYVNGAAAMTGRLLGGRDPRRPAGIATAAARPAAGEADGRRHRPPGRLLLLAAIAGTGLPLIALYGVGLVSPVSLVAIPTTLFLTVYLGSMLAATRVLHGLDPAGRRSRDGRHGDHAGLLRLGAGGSRRDHRGRHSDWIHSSVSVTSACRGKTFSSSTRCTSGSRSAQASDSTMSR